MNVITRLGKQRGFSVATFDVPYQSPWRRMKIVGSCLADGQKLSDGPRALKREHEDNKKEQPKPIGSMYGIYSNIGDILMVNVTVPYIAYMDPMGN